MQTLASNIAGWFRNGDASPADLAEAGGVDAFARWLERTSGDLLHVLQAHFQYPILHFFRPTERSRALPVQLGRLVELRKAAREADAGSELAMLGRHPSFRSLCSSVEEYLRGVDRRFVPHGIEEEEGDGNDGDETERAHGRLLRYMLFR